MFFRAIWVWVLMVGFGAEVSAQQRVILSGTVRDTTSGESILGAAVSVSRLKIGVETNLEGGFTLRLPADTITLRVIAQTYKPLELKLNLTADTTLLIHLEPQTAQLQDVVIEGEGFKQQLKSTQMSANSLNIQTLRYLPAFLGEVDPLKIIQLLPGIKSGTEGTTGFFVRGGGNDQNLIQLDGAVVYNPGHMGGLFGVFNQDIIKNVDVFKANFPAKYGGRLSSVLDVSSREGNKNKVALAGGIGLIASRLTVDVPIKKDKGTVVFAARRTYLDIFTRMINQRNEARQQNNNPNQNFNRLPDYYFFDLNLKADYRLSEKNYVVFSSFYSQDVLDLKTRNFTAGLAWRNIVGSLRWTHTFNNKLAAHSTVYVTHFNYEISNRFDAFRFEIGSRIRDYAVKLDFDYYPSDRQTVRWGGQYIRHNFRPNGLNLNNSQTGQSFLSFEKRMVGDEFGVYIADDYDITKKLRVNAGFRFSGFLAESKIYTGLEPRLGFRYTLSENWALKASYTRTYQYLHLVASAGVALPTDIWYPTTDRVTPQYANQYAAGISYLWKKAGLLFTNEVYYKDLFRQLELQEGAQIFTAPDLADEITFGRGWSYGNEILVERKEGFTTGWVGYTYAQTNRQFPDLNFGRVFPYRYDRRHDLSVVLNQRLTPRFSIGFVFIYRTGDAITLPNSRSVFSDISGVRNNRFDLSRGGIDQSFFPLYGERNSFRMPDYHRLDFSFTWKFDHKWGKSELIFSLYNLYNRPNPIFISFQTRFNENRIPTAIVPIATPLFPIIPAISWNFKY